MIKYSYYILMPIIIGQLSGCKSEQPGNGYPSHSVEMVFTALKQGKATAVAAIDHFEGSDVPVGQIAGIIANDSCIYITDSQRSQIHVLARKTYRYKRSIGSLIRGDPAFVYRPYSTQFYQGNLLAGNSHGSHILKMFTHSGEYVKEYVTNEILSDGGFATHLNNTFLKDSTIYIVNMFANAGHKLRRARLENNDAIILPEIVKVRELNSKVDSVHSRKIIPRMFVLRNNAPDTIFFAIPSNKYLVNKYGVDSVQLLESISLLGIPELRESFIFNTALNNLFSSAAIDEQSNIYIPMQEVIDVHAFKAGNFSDSNVHTYFVAVSLNDRKYTLYRLDRNRAIAPICFIDGKLWYYDLVMSQLIIYSLQ